MPDQFSCIISIVYVAWSYLPTLSHSGMIAPQNTVVKSLYFLALLVIRPYLPFPSPCSHQKYMNIYTDRIVQVLKFVQINVSQ